MRLIHLSEAASVVQYLLIPLRPLGVWDPLEDPEQSPRGFRACSEDQPTVLCRRVLSLELTWLRGVHHLFVVENGLPYGAMPSTSM